MLFASACGIILIMKDDKDFYNARNLKNLEKIEYLKDELPPFVDEYFLGIENQTSTLTRLNYAYDLRIFFDYLIRKKFREIKWWTLKV